MKKLIVLFFVVIAGVNLATLSVNASDRDYAFSFTIYPKQANGRDSAGRYRQTLSSENPWKVNLRQSNECEGVDKCITSFWLERKSGKNVSDTIWTTEREGEQYQTAYGTASEQTVYLTGQNNNNNNAKYKVTGYWDEETW